MDEGVLCLKFEHKLPLEDSSFDFIVSSLVLYFTTEGIIDKWKRHGE
jgi:hypothetical protein